jgi:hypothetical protein
MVWVVYVLVCASVVWCVCVGAGCKLLRLVGTSSTHICQCTHFGQRRPLEQYSSAPPQILICALAAAALVAQNKSQLVLSCESGDILPFQLDYHKLTDYPQWLKASDYYEIQHADSGPDYKVCGCLNAS